MEFLLLLSAMLTALTGAITGVRAPEPRVQQVASATVATRAVAQHASVTPAVRAAPDHRVPAVLAAPAALSPVSAVPLYLGRLRI